MPFALVLFLIVQGAVCDRGEMVSEISWRFPAVDVSCAGCNRVINRAVEQHVMSLLEVKSLRGGLPCRTAAPRRHVDYTRVVGCEVTLQTERFVSIQCFHEGHSPGGSSTSYSSLLFVVDRQKQKATRLQPAALFTAAGREQVHAALERIIRDQRGDDANVADEDIPSLADQMLDTVTVQPDGLHFLALGPHHSVFETTLATAAVGKWLAPPASEAIEIPPR